jgi:hypothetical protein
MKKRIGKCLEWVAEELKKTVKNKGRVNNFMMSSTKAFSTIPLPEKSNLVGRPIKLILERKAICRRHLKDG